MRESAVFLLVPLLFAACGGGGGDAPPQVFEHPLLVEENAYGGPAPDLAEIVAPAMFAELVESGAYTLVTGAGREAELAQALEEAVTNRATAEARFANESELLLRMRRSLQEGDPDATALPDGNVMFRGIREDPQRGTSDRWFQLEGTRFSDHELVIAGDEYEKRDTQVELYARFFEELPLNFKLQLQLPEPDFVAGEDFDFFHGLNETIGSGWGDLQPLPTPQPPPAGYPASWRDEIGASGQSGVALGLDRSGPEGLPAGLWAQVDFPLKYCATRVRAQGSRGLGVHFAITGAIEARVAAQYGRYVNLSEQFFYNQEFSRPDPLTSQLLVGITEGATPNQVLRWLRTSGFVYAYEHRWDYNPSWYRQTERGGPGLLGGFFDAPTYTRSCWADAAGTPYAGRFCSDTNRQSPMICTTHTPRTIPGPVEPLLGPMTICAIRDPVDMIDQESGVSLPSSVVVGHYRRRTLNHGIAKALLSRKIPIVYYFDIPRRTFNAPGGVLPFDPTDNEIFGSHAAVILGYVANADLRPGFPPGSGGGYYIVKNSWGTEYGDQGYFYAPDDWIAKYMISMHGILGTTG